MLASAVSSLVTVSLMIFLPPASDGFQVVPRLHRTCLPKSDQCGVTLAVEKPLGLTALRKVSAYRQCHSVAVVCAHSMARETFPGRIPTTAKQMRPIRFYVAGQDLLRLAANGIRSTLRLQAHRNNSRRSTTPATWRWSLGQVSGG